MIVYISLSISFLLFVSLISLSKFYAEHKISEKNSIFSYNNLWFFYLFFPLRLIPSYYLDIDTLSELGLVYETSFDMFFICISFMYTFRYPDQLKQKKYALLNLFLLIYLILSILLLLFLIFGTNLSSTR